MDPEACLNEAEEALYDGDTDTCRERLDSFREWADMFGFTDAAMLARAEKIRAALAAFGTKHVFEGHTFAVLRLEDGGVSVTCVDPTFDDDGTDQTLWPSVVHVGQWTGQTVVLVDQVQEAGKPECLYRIVKEGT